MGGFFGGDGSTPPVAERLQEDTIHVQSIERDNGIKTATYRSISSSLYDLSDTNSKTHTVKLPQGTTVKLAAPVRPGFGAYRARFEVIPVKGDVQTANGSDSAADLAKDLDVLALSTKQKTALQQMTEAELEALAEEHVPKLEEIQTHISGYVTKSGKHVGAYSQIRKAIAKLSPGSSLHLPDGVKVSKKGDGKFQVHDAGGSRLGGTRLGSSDAAAKQALGASASSTHPKSIGGRVSRSPESGFYGAKEIDAIPNSGDNPKLPGTPHPADVADRADKARKAAKLPSRKERAENERKAKDRNKSPMPGIIRTPAEADEIRAWEGQESTDRANAKKRRGSAIGHPAAKARREYKEGKGGAAETIDAEKAARKLPTVGAQALASAYRKGEAVKSASHSPRSRGSNVKNWGANAATIKALRKRGLIDEDGNLTDLGKKVGKLITTKSPKAQESAPSGGGLIRG